MKNSTCALEEGAVQAFGNTIVLRCVVDGKFGRCPVSGVPPPSAASVVCWRCGAITRISLG